MNKLHEFPLGLPPATPIDDRWQEIDSQRVLGELMRNLDGMVFRCALDQQWTFHFVSEGCLALTGYTREELEHNRGVSWEDLTHLEDRARVRQQIYAALQAGERYCLEYRIITRDGRERWVQERGVGVSDERGERVIEGFIEDITRRMDTYARLAQAELRFRSIFENSVIGIFQTSESGRYLAANPALAQLYGYASAEELIVTLSDIATRLYVDPRRRDEFKQQMASHGRVRDFESEVYRRDGSRIWISENAHVVRDADGKVLYYEGTVEDISERYHYQQQLQFQATHDTLTGLPNRNLLEDRLDQAMALARRQHGRLAVAFVDLDNFKLVNDSLGHAAGDRLLIEVADRLRSCLRETDTVARYGGDEFVLIINGQSALTDPMQAFERIQQALRQPLVLNGQELQMNCSIGVAVYPEDGASLDDLLRNADAAMYHAKEKGRNQFQFYTAHLNHAAHDRLIMELALRKAVEQSEIEVMYQPKIGADGLVSGCEALARWRHENLGQVSPAVFIPLAEEVGLIVPLTHHVLRTACREAASWQARGLLPIKIAVNLSARHFHDDHLVEDVAAILEETGLPAERLELEITESMLMGNIEENVAKLYRLKALGVSLAVDDFGTGYSSLAYLQRFPVDTLKIDRSFVMHCDRGEEYQSIPSTIITLGHRLGMRVVAEGVEKTEHLEFLSAEDCDEFQGYLFSKPLSAEDMAAYLLTGGSTGLGQMLDQ